jgi:hypothetical protein
VIVVVGATGILAPACASLAARGESVLAVARTARDLDRLQEESTPRSGELATLAADATAVGFVEQLSGYSLTGGLVYAPAMSPEATQWLVARLGRRLVEVVTSSYADPASRSYGERWDADRLRPAGHTRVVLGWALGEAPVAGDGEVATNPTTPLSRWHSAAEVSAAAVEALATESDRVLGVVAPWETRP